MSFWASIHVCVLAFEMSSWLTRLHALSSGPAQARTIPTRYPVPSIFAPHSDDRLINRVMDTWAIQHPPAQPVQGLSSCSHRDQIPIQGFSFSYSLISFPTLARPWPTTIWCVRRKGRKGFSRENSAPLCVRWLFPLTSTKAKSLTWQKLGEKRKRTYFFMIHNCKPISICYNHVVLVNNSNGLKGLHREKIKSSPPWIVLKKKHFLGPPSLAWCASLERPSTVWLRSQSSKPVLPGVLLPGFWKQALGLIPTWHIFWAHPKSTWQRGTASEGQSMFHHPITPCVQLAVFLVIVFTPSFFPIGFSLGPLPSYPS